MQVLIKRDFLGEKDVEYIGFLVQTHSFDRQEIFGLQTLQIGGFFKDVVYDLMLDHLKVNNSGDQRERRLEFFIERLNFVERAQWILFLALIELLVK